MEKTQSEGMWNPGITQRAAEENMSSWPAKFSKIQTPKVVASSIFNYEKPYGDPLVAQFEILILSVFKAPEETPRLIIHAKGTDPHHPDSFEWGWDKWRDFTISSYRDGDLTVATKIRADTLNPWENTQSVQDFTRSEIRGQAFRQHHRLFHKTGFSTPVNCAVREYILTREESAVPDDCPDEGDSTPLTFSFQRVFDKAGNAAHRPESPN